MRKFLLGLIFIVAFTSVHSLVAEDVKLKGTHKETTKGKVNDTGTIVMNVEK